MRGRAAIAVGVIVVLLLVLTLSRPAGDDQRLPPPEPVPAEPLSEGWSVPPALPEDSGTAVAAKEAAGALGGEADSRDEADQVDLVESPATDVTVADEPDGIEAAPVLRERTREMIPVAPGRPPPLRVADLSAGGLAAVSGTVEIAGERDPVVEEGLPVGITGRVVERGTGLPVPKAAVILHSAFYVRAIFYDHHLREVARAVTDADGEFHIDRLNVDPVHFGSDGKVYLSVVSPDHAPHPAIPLLTVSAGYRNRLADVALSRERYTLRGTVVDRWEGRPVVGGRVVATGEIQPIHYPKDQREALFLSSPETVTDEEGRFVLENVGPGTQMISVHGGDDCVGYLSVQVPGQNDITLRTRQIRGRIAGRVLDEWGDPVSLVKVDGGQNTTHTFADGSFVLENFRGDVISLRFDHTEFRSLTLTGIEDGIRELVARLESRLPLIKFDVKDAATGLPIKAILLTLMFAEGVAPQQPTSPHYLSEEGVHAVRLAVGARTAVIRADGYAPAQVDLQGRLDNDTVDVPLSR